MKLSVFTPTHTPKFLRGAFKSLLNQDHDDWEWIVAPNNGGSVPEDIASHPRVRVFEGAEGDAIGALKKFACSRAEGEVLVELDHDDLLFRNDALRAIADAAASSKASLVYSNNVRCDAMFKKQPRFGEQWGWKYREVSLKGMPFDELVAFESSPASVSRIWYAPDHIRAFRRDAYERVGGHNALRVLDDLDLMCRLYVEEDFSHIDAPLYLYRVHGENEWIRRNKEIQDGVMPMYDRYIEPMVLAWAKRRGLLALDLGGAHAPANGYLTVDRKTNADFNCDLNKAWPFPDNSVGVLRAADVLEHLRDPIHAMKEAQRVLVPGGYFLIQVPSTDGRGAFQDPTHKSFWNENSFLYYTDSRWAKYIDTPVRFQAMRLYTTAKDDRGVCWTRAHLISLKDGFRPPGIVSI